jgi:hypothetical protein
MAWFGGLDYLEDQTLRGLDDWEDFRVRVGINSRPAAIAPGRLSVKEKASGVTIFAVINYGLYVNFTVTAADSQTSTFILLGKPIR